MASDNIYGVFGLQQRKFNNQAQLQGGEDSITLENNKNWYS